MKKSTKCILFTLGVSIAGIYAYNKFIEKTASQKNLLSDKDGDYYAWMEIETKDEYTKDNSKSYEGGPMTMNDISGDVRYDAAAASWGSSWRMPTRNDISELINNCTFTNMTVNGVSGYKITGTNGNSIFLPAAGSRNGASLSSTGESGNYWSSTHGEYEDYDAFYLYFHGGIRYKSCNLRDNGQSVRPVID